MDFAKAKKLFASSTREKKIVTHSLANEVEFKRNLENFNRSVQSQGIKSTELQGDRDAIASTATPRLTSRSNGVNGFTPG